MGVLSFFKTMIRGASLSRWKELGQYQAVFTAFGNDVYMSDTVRACVRPLANYSSKARPTCVDKNVLAVLKNPNQYMTGSKMLYKVRTYVEIMNTAFIYIQRSDTGKLTGLYPVPFTWFEGVEYNDRLFVRFYFNSEATSELVLPWDDLAVIRNDYFRSDISGDSNKAILQTLELINTTNEGIGNAVKSSANLRGILKSTKGMLSPTDIKKQKDEFVKEYLNLENSGGIASLDATQEFTPINMSPVVTQSDQMREFRENVQRYFGVNDKIITSNMTEDEREAFYSSRIEPFLIELSDELTKKIFTAREIAFGKGIIYESNRLQFASTATKISMYKEVVLYGGMLRDEWREACNMPPLPNGEGQKMIMRLDAATTAKEGEQDGPEGEHSETDE